jgi:Neuraminidase (sialidase)
VQEPWLEIDRSPTSPFKNSLYLSASHLAIGHHANLYDITVSHSKNSGSTWTTKTVNRSSGITVTGLSHLAISNNGTVFVTWLSCKVTGSEGDATCGGTRATFWISSSSDGGNTWTPPRAVTTALLAPDLFAYTKYGLLPNTSTSVPVLDIPVVAVDNTSLSSSGNLYVAFYNYNGTHLQVGMTTSKDGGFTWSSAKRVSEVNHGDQYAPWVSVADDGTVGVSWLDRRADSFDYQPVFAVSHDEGATFSDGIALSPVLSNPDWNSPNAAYYRTHQWVGNTVFATWVDTRTGKAEVELGGVQF